MRHSAVNAVSWLTMSVLLTTNKRPIWHLPPFSLPFYRYFGVCVCVCVHVYYTVFFMCFAVCVYSVYWCVCVCARALLCTLSMMWYTWKKRIGSEADWPPTSESDRALLAQSYVLLNLTSSLGWQVKHGGLRARNSACYTILLRLTSVFTCTPQSVSKCNVSKMNMTCLHAKVQVI